MNNGGIQAEKFFVFVNNVIQVELNLYESFLLMLFLLFWIWTDSFMILGKYFPFFLSLELHQKVGGRKFRSVGNRRIC